MEKELLAVESLKRFFDWTEGVVQNTIAKHGRLKEKFVDRELGYHCFCFQRDIHGDSSFPHFQICKIHSREFSIGDKLFESFTYKELEARLASDELRTNLADMLFSRKKVYLPQSFDLSTLSRIADEEFPGISGDRIKFVCYAAFNQNQYGDVTGGAVSYLTLATPVIVSTG